jgi:hypothetical protein
MSLEHGIKARKVHKFSLGKYPLTLTLRKAPGNNALLTNEICPFPARLGFRIVPHYIEIKTGNDIR